VLGCECRDVVAPGRLIQECQLPLTRPAKPLPRYAMLCYPARQGDEFLSDTSVSVSGALARLLASVQSSMCCHHPLEPCRPGTPLNLSLPLQNARRLAWICTTLSADYMCRQLAYITRMSEHLVATASVIVVALITIGGALLCL
jgi:hypothetical protein